MKKNIGGINVMEQYNCFRQLEKDQKCLCKSCIGHCYVNECTRKIQKGGMCEFKRSVEACDKYVNKNTGEIVPKKTSILVCSVGNKPISLSIKEFCIQLMSVGIICTRKAITIETNNCIIRYLPDDPAKLRGRIADYAFGFSTETLSMFQQNYITDKSLFDLVAGLELVEIKWMENVPAFMALAYLGKPILNEERHPVGFIVRADAVDGIIYGLVTKQQVECMTNDNKIVSVSKEVKK